MTVFSTSIITTIATTYLTKTSYFKGSFIFMAKKLYLLLKSLREDLNCERKFKWSSGSADYQINHIFSILNVLFHWTFTV